MSSTLSKIVMVIAIACLGNYGREWARLMLAEFRIASEEGRPLSFAFQCLWRALREMPKHQEGRLALGRYGVALFLMLPIAAILTAGAIGGYPFIDLPGLHPHAASEWAPGGVNEGNRFAMQTLTTMFAILAVRMPMVAWLVTERNWARIGNLQRLAAAIITTIAIFTSVLMREALSAALPALLLGLEFAAVATLARWHALAHGKAEEADTAREPAYEQARGFISG